MLVLSRNWNFDTIPLKGSIFDTIFDTMEEKLPQH